MSSTDDRPPEPPEEPLPSDCCGSGCATCVMDVFAEQQEEYERELAEWKEKNPDAVPLHKKTVPAKSDATASSVDFLKALRDKMASSGVQDDDDDDDDDGEFLDQDLEVGGIGTSSSHRSSRSRFANAVTVNLMQPPASVARGAVVDDSSDQLLTFRKDDEREWTPAVQLAPSSTADGEPDDFCQTSFLELTKIRGGSDSLKFRPGDTVEVLSLPSRAAVEKFLRSFAGDFKAQKEARAGSLLAEPAEPKTPYLLSDGIFLDIDRFPFVDSQLPPWLEKCSSMLRTQHSALRTRGGLQTLSLGHLMRTVVDVYSYSALQRPLLAKLLDIAESQLLSTGETGNTNTDSRTRRLEMEVAALKELTRLPVAGVHEFVRFAWAAAAAGCESSSSSSNNEDHVVIKDVANSSSVQLPTSRVQLPDVLMSFAVKKLPDKEQQHLDRTPLDVGSVQFLLERCFYASVKTTLFSANAPLRDFSASASAAPKLLTLPRLLEVAPPLRGRFFSVAERHTEKEIITLLSNFKHQHELWCVNNLIAERAKLISTRPPSWAGIVSARLGRALERSIDHDAPLFVRSGSTALSQSNAAKRRMLRRSCSSSPSSARAANEIVEGKSFIVKNDTRLFAQSLDDLEGEQQQQQHEETKAKILFFAAGTGIAPFRFYFQQQVRALDHSRPITRHPISLFFAVRNPLQRASIQMIDQWLKTGVLSQVSVAVSAPSHRDLPSPQNENFMMTRRDKIAGAASSFVENSLESSSRSIRVFSCGPPGFVKMCKELVSNFAPRKEDASGREQREVLWSNDDWSS